jgi:2-C-methyl-D-erythritol 4-phosphate cytidylyltransferase
MLESTRTAWVIPAAGSGQRLGADRPKALVPFGGRPLLAATLERLAEAGIADLAVITAPASDLRAIEEVVASSARLPAREVRVVVGGATRQASVAVALAALAECRVEIVAVHDAARPLVAPASVVEVFRRAAAGCAATLGRRPVDSLREDCGEATRAVPRGRYWLVETPQAFRFELLVEAHRRAVVEEFEATDDASLVEHYGTPVAVVESAGANPKITVPGDLAVAEALRERLPGRR